MIKKIKFFIFFIFLFLISFNSFTAEKPIKLKKIFDCNNRFKKAIERFNLKKYYDANNILTEVLTSCPGHDAYDSMLYYQGRCLIALKKYQDAKTEFEKLIQTYPNSSLYEESYFLVGYCMYMGSNPVELDQTQTKEAISRLNDFLGNFPNSLYADSAKKYIEKATDKLAEKEFLAAKFYERIEQYESAVVYYKLVAQDYPESRFMPLALLGAAENLIRTNRNKEASEIIEELLQQTKDETIIKKANILKQKIKK